MELLRGIEKEAEDVKISGEGIILRYTNSQNLDARSS